MLARSLIHLSCLAILGAVMTAQAVPVVNWVTTNGDADYTEGTAATSSPVTTNADADTIVGSFPSVTLGVSESIALTGSIAIFGKTGSIPGNQIRWALFDAPAVPETGVGSGYVGVWATVAGGGLPSNVNTADGTTDNPFSGSATTVVVSATDEGGGGMRYETTYSFSLTITRVDESSISISSMITDGADFLIEWPATIAPASPASFTYDTVGILLGGTTDAESATLTNIEISTNSVAPQSLEITDIIYDSEGGMITLTWISEPGKTYAIDASSDLNLWPGDIDDSVAASEDSSTTSFTFENSGLGSRQFFRVRDVTN